MSRCRCDDKDECNRKIAILESAQWRFGGANGCINSLGEDIDEARLHYHKCMRASKLQKCVTYIGQLDDEVPPVRDSIDGKISDKISDLYYEFEQLDQEDYDYHEEERRREEEEEEERKALAAQQSLVGVS